MVINENDNIDYPTKYLLSLIFKQESADLYYRAITDHNISVEDFINPLHRQLFEIIVYLVSEHGKISKDLVLDRMKTKKLKLAHEDITTTKSTLDNFEYFCKRIKRNSHLLKIKSFCQNTLIDLDSTYLNQDSDLEPDHLIQNFENISLAITNNSVQTFIEPCDIVPDLFNVIRNGEPMSSVTTPWHNINEALNGVPNDYMIIGARPSMGKEQPIDTPVLTKDGWKPIGELKVCDFIYTQDGTLTTVTHIFPQGYKDVYKVTFRDGTSTECGLEHLWEVYPDGGYHKKKKIDQKSMTLSLKELLKRGITREKGSNRHGAKYRIPIVEPLNYPKQNLPIDPYVLGVLLGDGAISGDDLRFSNSDRDRDISERMSEILLKDNITLREYRKNTCPYFTLKGNIKTFKQNLSNLGVRVKSKEKFIPKPYLIGSIEQRLELLRGLMDTDGSCTKNAAKFHSCSKELAYGVEDLVRSLGGVAWVKANDRSHHNKPTEYNVTVKMNICPFYTKFKKQSWRPNNQSRYIWRIEKLNIQKEQVCIKVAHESQLYVVNDYIVTHNSAWALDLYLHNTVDHGIRGAYQSLEMSSRQLGMRSLARLSEVELWKIKKRDLNGEELQRLEDAARRFSQAPIHIDQTAGLTAKEVCGRITRLKIKYPDLKFVIIDHLQKIKGSENDLQRNTMASNEFFNLRKKLDIAVILLVQLNRNLESESRKDKRPVLSDIRGAGALEEDGAVIGFLHSDNYHDSSLKSQPVWSSEFILGKNRDGSLGNFPLRFNRSIQKFEE